MKEKLSLTAVAVSESFPQSPRLRGSHLKGLMRPQPSRSPLNPPPLAAPGVFILAAVGASDLLGPNAPRIFFLCAVCVLRWLDTAN